MDHKLLIKEFDESNGYPIAKWLILKGIGANNSPSGLDRQIKILKQLKAAGYKFSY